MCSLRPAFQWAAIPQLQNIFVHILVYFLLVFEYIIGHWDKLFCSFTIATLVFPGGRDFFFSSPARHSSEVSVNFLFKWTILAYIYFVDRKWRYCMVTSVVYMGCILVYLHPLISVVQGQSWLASAVSNFSLTFKVCA